MASPSVMLPELPIATGNPVPSLLDSQLSLSLLSHSGMAEHHGKTDGLMDGLEVSSGTSFPAAAPEPSPLHDDDDEADTERKLTLSLDELIEERKVTPLAVTDNGPLQNGRGRSRGPRLVGNGRKFVGAGSVPWKKSRNGSIIGSVAPPPPPADDGHFSSTSAMRATRYKRSNKYMDDLPAGVRVYTDGATGGVEMALLAASGASAQRNFRHSQNRSNPYLPQQPQRATSRPHEMQSLMIPSSPYWPANFRQISRRGLVTLPDGRTAMIIVEPPQSLYPYPPALLDGGGLGPGLVSSNGIGYTAGARRLGMDGSPRSADNGIGGRQGKRNRLTVESKVMAEDMALIDTEVVCEGPALAGGGEGGAAPAAMLLRFKGTDLLRVTKGRGDLILSSGGWRTLSTRAVLNRALKPLGLWIEESLEPVVAQQSATLPKGSEAAPSSAASPSDSTMPQSTGEAASPAKGAEAMEDVEPAEGSTLSRVPNRPKTGPNSQIRRAPDGSDVMPVWRVVDGKSYLQSFQDGMVIGNIGNTNRAQMLARGSVIAQCIKQARNDALARRHTATASL